MGVSNCLVLGTPEQLPDIAKDATPWKTYGGVFSKIDLVSMCILMDIISGQNIYASSLTGFPLAYAEDLDEGPWITTIHGHFIPLIYHAEHNNIIADVCQRWAAEDELEGWEPGGLEALIKQMADLFRRAEAENKTVYMVSRNQDSDEA